MDWPFYSTLTWPEIRALQVGQTGPIAASVPKWTGSWWNWFLHHTQMVVIWSLLLLLPIFGISASLPSQKDESYCRSILVSYEKDLVVSPWRGFEFCAVRKLNSTGSLLPGLSPWKADWLSYFSLSLNSPSWPCPYTHRYPDVKKKRWELNQHGISN